MHEKNELHSPKPDLNNLEQDDGIQDRKKIMKSFFREISETLLLAILTFLIINVSVQNYIVDGESMAPTVNNQNLLLVSKLSYFDLSENKITNMVNSLPTEKLENLVLKNQPDRGDIIVFRQKNSGGNHLIKRVIGIPGDTINISNGIVFINNNRIDEPYIYHIDKVSHLENMLISKDTFFVMGDNRPISKDSRSWGTISKTQIIGQAWLLYWPIRDLSLVTH